MGAKQSISPILESDFYIKHDLPSKLLINSPIYCRPEGYSLDIQPNIKNRFGHTVTDASNGTKFPLQVEGTETNGIYNILYLRDTETDEVPAVIVQELNPHTRRQQPVFSLYAFKPKFEGQRATRGLGEYSSSSLYEWARLERHVSFGITSYYIWTGLEHTQAPPTYIAAPMASKVTLTLLGALRYTPHDFQVMQNNKTVATITGKHDSEDWHLRVGSGQDPALLIALTAILDEIFMNDLQHRIELFNEL